MWARIASVAAGIWLMAAPAVLDLREPARSNDHIVGALAASLAAIAVAEVTRPVRWTGVPLGAWLLLAPWVLGYDQWSATLNDSGVGIALALFALVRGRVSQRFAGGWSSLWSSSAGLGEPPDPSQERGPIGA